MSGIYQINSEQRVYLSTFPCSASSEIANNRKFNRLSASGKQISKHRISHSTILIIVTERRVPLLRRTQADIRVGTPQLCWDRVRESFDEALADRLGILIDNYDRSSHQIWDVGGLRYIFGGWWAHILPLMMLLATTNPKLLDIDRVYFVHEFLWKIDKAIPHEQLY